MATISPPIPVIDLFAGPGGLGEGFSCLRNPDGTPCFDIRLSIEKDPVAHRTLELRSFFRSLQSRVPDCYYDYLRGKISREQLFAIPSIASNAALARAEAWNMTLAPESHEIVSSRVANALGTSPGPWVLIGGPPCQAYSLVGRSRMKADGVERFEQDHRHFLYREYLRIIAEHGPQVFIMENVKGLLSATHGGSRMFERIVSDLECPEHSDHRYRVVPLAGSDDPLGFAPADFVLKAERFGVPQARHRVILCGIREGFAGLPRPIMRESTVTVADALAGLPAIRGRLSKEHDSHADWLCVLAEARKEIAKSRGLPGVNEIKCRMDDALARARSIRSSGEPFTALCAGTWRGGTESPRAKLHDWLRDPGLEGVTGHESRSHMRSDLKRYFFAASLASATGISPKIRDFPECLLPNHKNATADAGNVPFEDRFRVQVAGRPATTVVSHISKDGHYFIHPDPAQCRSLTVREAARLQTFPDNYHFEGNRTQQFVQVGNAVPPYLAAKIAESVHAVLVDSPPYVHTR